MSAYVTVDELRSRLSREAREEFDALDADDRSRLLDDCEAEVDQQLVPGRVLPITRRTVDPADLNERQVDALARAVAAAAEFALHLGPELRSTGGEPVAEGSTMQWARRDVPRTAPGVAEALAGSGLSRHSGLPYGG